MQLCPNSVTAPCATAEYTRVLSIKSHLFVGPSDARRWELREQKEMGAEGSSVMMLLFTKTQEGEGKCKNAP